MACSRLEQSLHLQGEEIPPSISVSPPTHPDICSPHGNIEEMHPVMELSPTTSPTPTYRSTFIQLLVKNIYYLIYKLYQRLVYLIIVNDSIDSSFCDCDFCLHKYSASNTKLPHIILLWIIDKWLHIVRCNQIKQSVVLYIYIFFHPPYMFVRSLDELNSWNRYCLG